MTGRLRIVTSGLIVETSGLRQMCAQPELRARVDSEELLSGCEDLYGGSAKRVLNDGEAFAWRDPIPFEMSVLEFVPLGDVLEVWQYDPQQGRSQAAVSDLVRTLTAQRRTCSEHGVEPIFPSVEQFFFTVSRRSDLREIEIVKGVRSIPISNADSGWVFHNAGSEQKTKPLRRHHIAHLLEARDQFVEVISMLALPPGYWFDDSGGNSLPKYRVWFDPGVLDE